MSVASFISKNVRIRVQSCHTGWCVHLFLCWHSLLFCMSRLQMKCADLEGMDFIKLLLVTALQYGILQNYVFSALREGLNPQFSSSSLNYCQVCLRDLMQN